ncbi:venom dipeptidyl peptidase 4-like [Frankliniella occidentalis]|nr:venom dipeptidyl peptidase 4-like [Frankliniella occidentalis]
MWMSDGGHSVLFATFNDTLVEEMKIPWYGTVDEDRQYPDIRSLRYPKPGTPNPIVTLRVANLTVPSDIRTRDLEPPLAFGFNR